MDKMITVRVSAEQHKQIKMLSAETGLSIKEIFWLGVDRAGERGGNNEKSTQEQKGCIS